MNTTSKSATRRSALALAITAALLLAPAACGPEGGWRTLASAFEPLFANGDFETDGGSLAGWTVTTYLNDTGLAAVPPTSFAQLQLSNGGFVASFPETDATPESQLFAGMDAGAGVPRWPKFGTTSAVINRTNGQIDSNANSLKQSYTVTYADVDPGDGKVHVRFVLAPALQAAGHAPAQQPYFFVILRNLTTAQTLFTDFNYANSPGVPWKVQGTGDTAVLYTDWAINDIAPGNVNLRVGDTIELEIIASRCQPTGHFGEVYVDGFGSTFPGISVRKTAPQFANVDSDITYNFTVQNNTTGLANNVIAREVLPFAATFVSVNSTWPGYSCTTPPVGSTGTVVCNFGPMNPGAVATFQVTVRNYPPAPNGTGTATAGTNNSLTDISKTWTPNAFGGWSAYLVGGPGVGQVRTITSNTGNQLTVTPNWAVNPTAATNYKIVDPPQLTGTTSGSTPGSLSDGTQAWMPNQWIASTVTVLSGPATGQQRLITSNTGNLLTVTPNWSPPPGNGAGYAIGLPPDKVVNGNYTVEADTVSPLLGPRVETIITSGVRFTDLAISVTNDVPAVDWNTPVTYTITVTNNGPLDVVSANVTDTFPSELTGITWTCATSGLGSCGAASGNGNINTTVSLPIGASATFTVNATVINGTGTGILNNVASVSAPAGLTDLDSRNNSDADTDNIGALFTLTVNKNPAGLGQGTVTSAPAAINCGPACPTAASPYASGTVVTLTAVARPGDTFAGWSGACTGNARTCDVTMDAAKTVGARFRGPTVTAIAGTGGSVVCTPAEVAQGTDSTCTITPDPDYIFLRLEDNGSNQSGSVVGGVYDVQNVTSDHTVQVTFDRRPDFVSSAPPNTAQGTPYVYTPVVTDPDGPGPLSYSLGPTDTCGGTLDPATGEYTFNPGAGASCVVAIQVCDGAGACRTQETTVLINHPPVAVNDTLTAGGTVNIQGGTLTGNDSPGGPPSETSSQTVTITSVSGTSAQGGTVTLSGGVVTYTPPAGFTGTDTFTYTITDNGNPSLTSTATVTITIDPSVPPDFLPGLGASGGGCGCSAGDVTALPWYGLPALLMLLRRRRRAKP